MSALVWLLMLYSAATVTLLTCTEGIPVYLGMIYDVLCGMALACHAKTSLTDPGSVPLAAIPSEKQRLMKDSHSMCGQCQTFKPPMSHHCRICNRCISRMDHHCPWMNNCVGAGNLSKCQTKIQKYVFENESHSFFSVQNTFSSFFCTPGPVPPLPYPSLAGITFSVPMKTVLSTQSFFIWFVL